MKIGDDVPPHPGMDGFKCEPPSLRSGQAFGHGGDDLASVDRYLRRITTQNQIVCCVLTITLSQPSGHMACIFHVENPDPDLSHLRFS
jgi:hypothetical protein